MKEITVRRNKFENINTEYGYISYSAWCMKEVNRIKHGVEYKENSKLCWIVKPKGGEDGREKELGV